MDNTPYCLLDIRGLMIQSLNMGEDPDGPLDDKGKTQNSAEYGFAKFLEFHLLPVFENTPPRRVIAVWDGGNDYRRGIFPGYKKRRSEREYTEYATEQMDKISTLTSEMLAATGCTQCKVPGVEADDVLAYFCQQLPGHKFVHTVDKDLVQLDCETVDVFYQGEAAKYADDLPDPRHIALTKSLLGDTSDEYPGIKGFGEKKLQAIVREFGEDVLDDLETCIKTRQFDDIRAARSDAVDKEAIKGFSLMLENEQEWILQYDLAIAHPELCYGRDGKKFTQIKWVKRVPNYFHIEDLLQQGLCEDLLLRFEPYWPKYELVTMDNWDAFATRFEAELERTPFFAFDYESYDALQHKPFNEAKRSGGDYVDVLSQSITGMSINYGEHLQYTSYISVDHADTNNVPDDYLKDILETALEGGKRLVAHNAPFEMALTDTNFLTLLDDIADTRLMAHSVDENDSNHLKDLSKLWLGYAQTSYKATLENAGVSNMRELTGEQVLHYGCDDSIVTAMLADLFFTILHLEGTWDFCDKEEVATNAVLYEGFESGIKIDYSRLSFLADEDEVAFNTNMAILRGVLLQNCREIVPERSRELFNEVSEYTEAKMQMDGADQGKIDAKLAVLEKSLSDSTRYEPLIEEAPEVKFVATAHQINKLMKSQFNIDIELTGVTPPKVTEFRMKLAEILTDDHVDEDAEMREFLVLLSEASSELKKRKGEFYDAFYAECVRLLSKDLAPVTTGDQLNLDSPIQMQQLMYCKMGLPIRLHAKLQRGSTREKLGYREGGPSADDKAIDTALAEDCPEGDWRREALLSLKEAKAANTRRKNYWRPYPLWQHPRDGLLHGSIINCGTVTKRFTGSNPNLLQLTSKDGGRVRTIVLPKKEDHVILSPDFNGEELRITASLSRDPVMIDAYIGPNPRDLHSITASAISGAVLDREAPRLLASINFEMINGLMTMVYDEFLRWLAHDDKDTANIFKNIRKLAKGVNFLLIYVGGPSTLARNLGVPTEIAEQFLNAAMATYPRLGPWQQESIEFAREHGHVLTSYGNRRHIGNGIFSDDNGTRTRLERQAVNSQVQGTGSDIMKVVLRGIKERKLFVQTNASLIVPPYDEITVSVPRSAAWDLWLGMQEVMTLTPPGHQVPQLPELKASALNWGTCIELGAFPTEEEFNETMDKQLAERAAA